MFALARRLLLACALIGAVAPASANTLRWAGLRDIASLDPDSFGDTFTLAFLNHVYEGLVRYDANLQVEPALATKWEVISPTTWRFHLRAGVKFHDGAVLTADDVVASLKRATHESSPLKGNLSAFKDASVVDPLTVDVELNSTYPLLLNDLTNIYIFSKPWLVANKTEMPTDVGKGIEGYATTHANGTGPFIVESRVIDQRTVLNVNPAWWDKPRHNLTRIEFSPIGSDATRLAGLMSAQIDYTNSVPLQTVNRLEGVAGVTLLAATELRTVFFTLKLNDKLFGSDITDRNPLRDIRVRKALYHAIDAESLKRSLMRGFSRPTGALVAPAIPGYTPAQEPRLAYDVEAAKKLLTEAGYPNGFSLTLVCATDGLVNEEPICQAASAMWARIGIKTTLSIGPRATTTQRRVGGQFDITILGWANEPAIDAYSILLQVMHSKTAAAGVFNWGNWGDARIDALTDAAAGELNLPKRLDQMSRALMVAKDDVLFLPLHQQPMIWAKRDNVTDVVQLPDNKPRHWLTRMK
jgi:peptide/nickel transport system substrate-binding protein